jgi:hypothetical protein
MGPRAGLDDLENRKLILLKVVKYFELFAQSGIPCNVVWDNLFKYMPK